MGEENKYQVLRVMCVSKCALEVREGRRGKKTEIESRESYSFLFHSLHFLNLFLHMLEQNFLEKE